ncbi:MAG: hypothetical protein Q4A84_10965 [Neisseria sp.]|uniref:hypothetical protein n=1 Tax=Neisseria sp. TaxID=192066 RepID=UPI0026DB235E|nr:hypothetical protein [Neisseria sp.]MDO4642199.1 hypothetical protein [Neisseria sp.]
MTIEKRLWAKIQKEIGIENWDSYYLLKTPKNQHHKWIALSRLPLCRQITCDVIMSKCLKGKLTLVENHETWELSIEVKP